MGSVGLQDFTKELVIFRLQRFKCIGFRLIEQGDVGIGVDGLVRVGKLKLSMVEAMMQSILVRQFGNRRTGIVQNAARFENLDLQRQKKEDIGSEWKANRTFMSNNGIDVDVISFWLVNANLPFWLDHGTPKVDAQSVVYNSSALAIQRREAFTMLEGS
ncbi:hypothetical protein J1N35_000753 [Gossypium stocksii]|uniref:Uncharacterized protein n=1 Tax=Gossypium stocksii TaxID=47602 RepID=A0A9D4AIY5_9ROSI|nr:hypothetical protein J1N35_000753 [Gossypium stocksii]